MANEDVKVEQAEVPEVSESETRARELGWKPEKEYEGDKRWVNADEFLERQELYDGIHKANRKAKKLEKVIDNLVLHNKKIEEVAIQKALDKLRQEKKVAAKENDIEKVVDIDEQIEKTKETLTTTTKASGSTDDILEEFKESNPWFDPSSNDFDKDMQIYANGLGYELEKEHKDWSHEKLLAEVAKGTKKAFEYKFKNENRKVPSKVSSKENKDTPVNRAKVMSYDELSPEGKSMFKVLVKNDKTNPHGVMTAEQYLADYSYAQSAQKRGK